MLGFWSNLCEELLRLGNKVFCLITFQQEIENIIQLLDNPILLIEGDIRNFDECLKACQDVDYVLHQAAIGSVPRSIENPITSNDVNVSGFLNMLVAARDNRVKRFIYAASSSTYGDSEALPKVENNIGKPLSPYAITKYVNELYADVFSKIYDIEVIDLDILMFMVGSRPRWSLCSSNSNICKPTHQRGISCD